MGSFNPEKEPDICEIERRLWRAKEYLEAKQYSKVNGCLNSLWHTVTDFAERLESERRSMEYHIETVRRNAYKDPYNIDENEMQSAVEHVIKSVSNLKDVIITRKAFALESKFSTEALSEAWDRYYDFAKEEYIKDFGWREEGRSQEEIEKWINEWMLDFPPNLPHGTKVRMEGKGVDIIIPIRDRYIRDGFASIDKGASDFFSKHFSTPCRISYDYLY